MSHRFRIVGPLPDRVVWTGVAVIARDGRGRALMQLRDGFSDVASAGKWSLFGGGVEAGEVLEAAARREFEEETGIAIVQDRLRPRVTVASQTLAGGVVHVFALDRPIRPEDITLGEGAGFGFLTRAQVERFDLIENFRRILLEMEDF